MSSSDRTTTVNELRELVQQFVDERDWNTFHNPKNLSMSLAIEAGELMEHFRTRIDNENEVCFWCDDCFMFVSERLYCATELLATYLHRHDNVLEELAFESAIGLIAARHNVMKTDQETN